MLGRDLDIMLFYVLENILSALYSIECLIM